MTQRIFNSSVNRPRIQERKGGVSKLHNRVKKQGSGDVFQTDQKNIDMDLNRIETNTRVVILYEIY